MNRYCDTEGQEDYFDHGELRYEARHRLVPRQARDLLPFILREIPFEVSYLRKRSLTYCTRMLRYA
jgi:hypothetical protein